ncbi:MAG TPA: CAP domain-containing protein [Solirubrobacteraceae bacterium]|jgi:uncharacterized protein YkwD|nr:CAP domain-containing protein [Solirubrobacteraceae bacterium]
MAAVVIASMSLASVAAARDRGCARAHTPITAAPRAALQRAVVCLINRQRHSYGLPGMLESSRLNRSAQGWTNTMVARRDFSHGADFGARITATGFRWSNAGENIATGFRTPAAVVSGWMASTGHCQNILNPAYRDVGTGVSRRPIAGYSSGGGTWTQDFGLPMGQPAASPNWGPADSCPH